MLEYKWESAAVRSLSKGRAATAAFEKINRLCVLSGFFVELRRNYVIEAIPRVGFGESPRHREARVQTADPRLNADQIAFERGIFGSW